MLPKALTRHPQSVGETYGQHLRMASGFGARMIGAGCACMVHALLPFLFEKTGSEQIRLLHNKLVSSRRGPTSESDIAWHI